MFSMLKTKPQNNNKSCHGSKLNGISNTEQYSEYSRAVIVVRKAILSLAQGLKELLIITMAKINFQEDTY
jgi:hypothetical protein